MSEVECSVPNTRGEAMRSSVMGLRVRELAVLIVGVAAAVGLALTAGASASDTAEMIAMAAGASLTMAVIAIVVLRRSRGAPMVVQVLVIALGAVASAAAGVLLASRAMFLSNHDLSVLGVVLTVSAAVAVAGAIELSAVYQREVAKVESLMTAMVPSPTGPITSVAAGMTGTDDTLVTSRNELHRLARTLSNTAAELEAARRRQSSLEASRRELVSWVSHDLRSPISSIRAMAEALEDAVVTEVDDVRRFHSAIASETIRLGALVDDLFELSRIESGSLAANPEMVDAEALIAEAVDSTQPAAAARGINLVNLFTITPPECGTVPAADLRRVLHNLLDNAVRHTRPGGSVVVDGEIRHATLHLAVTDECGGIPTEEIPRVFDVAYRGDTARSRDAGGGGLGLAIAKGLVEARHGVIDVANRGHGCRFSLSIPVVQE
jgi:signal transduction histidine kinase